MIRITYQKKDGCIFYKTRTTMLPYKIGETTSMGWKVLNIEREYKNEYYPLHKYNTLIEFDKQKFLKKKRTTTMVVNEAKMLLYCLLAATVVNFLKLFFGI